MYVSNKHNISDSLISVIVLSVAVVYMSPSVTISRL